MTEDTRQAIRADMSASASEVAGGLYMNLRTLQRRLAAEGTSFSDLKDEERRRLAHEALTGGLRPIEVSAVLDFSEQSTLSRSCRRWFGRRPSAIRKEAAS